MCLSLILCHPDLYSFPFFKRDHLTLLSNRHRTVKILRCIVIIKWVFHYLSGVHCHKWAVQVLMNCCTIIKSCGAQRSCTQHSFENFEPTRRRLIIVLLIFNLHILIQVKNNFFLLGCQTLLVSLKYFNLIYL